MSAEQSASRFNWILQKAQAAGPVVVGAAIVVVAAAVFSSFDFFQKERNVADQATMKELSQLCRSTLAPFNPNSPVNTLSKKTMDNVDAANRVYCASTSRARSFDSLSL